MKTKLTKKPRKKRVDVELYDRAWDAVRNAQAVTASVNDELKGFVWVLRFSHDSGGACKRARVSGMHEVPKTKMIRRTSVKRKRSRPRRGPLRDKGYRAFVRRQYYCAVFESPVSECSLFVEIDAAHTRNNGMGSKGPDSSCAPLCRIHHREYNSGRKAFEKKYGVDMKAIASQYWERYQQEKAE